MLNWYYASIIRVLYYYYTSGIVLLYYYVSTILPLQSYLTRTILHKYIVHYYIITIQTFSADSVFFFSDSQNTEVWRVYQLWDLHLRLWWCHLGYQFLGLGHWWVGETAEDGLGFPHFSRRNPKMIPPPKKKHLVNVVDFWSGVRRFETDIMLTMCSVMWGDEDSKTSVATVNYLLRLQKRVMFVTNNSNKTRAQFVQQTLDPDEPRFYLWPLGQDSMKESPEFFMGFPKMGVPPNHKFQYYFVVIHDLDDLGVPNLGPWKTPKDDQWSIWKSECCDLTLRQNSGLVALFLGKTCRNGRTFQVIASSR